MQIFKIELIKKHHASCPTTFHIELPEEAIDVRETTVRIKQKYMEENLMPYLDLVHAFSKYQEVRVSAKVGRFYDPTLVLDLINGLYSEEAYWC